jgi:hypothetical protein
MDEKIEIGYRTIGSVLGRCTHRVASLVSTNRFQTWMKNA